jgi:hypothetical protein
LFSLLKRLFPNGDAGHRVGGVASFAELEAKIAKEFENSPEDFAMEYNWANWDIDAWLAQMAPGQKNIFDGKLARISFDNVFRYALVVLHEGTLAHFSVGSATWS